jgi:hypothetical protein
MYDRRLAMRRVFRVVCLASQLPVTGVAAEAALQAAAPKLY